MSVYAFFFILILCQMEIELLCCTTSPAVFLFCFVFRQGLVILPQLGLSLQSSYLESLSILGSQGYATTSGGLFGLVWLVAFLRQSLTLNSLGSPQTCYDSFASAFQVLRLQVCAGFTSWLTCLGEFRPCGGLPVLAS